MDGRGLESRRGRKRRCGKSRRQDRHPRLGRRLASASHADQAAGPRHGGPGGERLRPDVHGDGELRRACRPTAPRQSVRDARSRAKAGARNGAGDRHEAQRPRRCVRDRRLPVRADRVPAGNARGSRPRACARGALATGVQLGAQPARPLFHGQGREPGPGLRDVLCGRSPCDRDHERARQPAQHHSRHSRHRGATDPAKAPLVVRGCGRRCAGRDLDDRRGPRC